jgi:hypothetical protein
MVMLRAQLAGGCPAADVEALDSETLREQFQRWTAEEGPWWALSFTLHLLLLASLLLVGNRAIGTQDDGTLVLAPTNVEVAKSVPDFDPNPPEVWPREDPDRDPPDINVMLPPKPAEKVAGGDGGELPKEKLAVVGFGGGTPDGEGIPASVSPFSDFGLGAAHKGLWVDPRLTPRDGPVAGPGGPGRGGFPPRKIGTGDDTKTGVVSAVGALHWLARHQQRDGGFSLQHYPDRCKDATCTGPGTVESETAAAALATLPFLAAGQTHLSRGPFQKTVAAAVGWLLRHQKADGDLREGSTMYAHALATITLCEVYGMTGDRAVGYAAQRAVAFIQNAQNAKTGGWRYQPGDEGDLSVVGWQVMALKSAQMAGLPVDGTVLERAKAFLQAVASPNPDGSAGSSASGGLFAYTPGGRASTTMTSVGLLCHQYLGMHRDDPLMANGTAHLLRNLPDPADRDLYYWYYATQVMHNQPGPDWDAWQRKMRRMLVESQNREGCAAGSWDPHLPATDRWGVQGGRLMMTSLAALTLEVYYRYLPLYKLDGKEGAKEGIRD